MWYNVESGEHRWELPLDGAVLRHALRSASKGERSSCCATDDVCANAWVSCVTEAEGGTVDTERKAALEVWMARTGNDMSEEELAMRTTGVAIFTDIAHSLPFTCPVGKWPAEAYGASAADAQLLRLRAADASSSPPPSNDPLWRRCARGWGAVGQVVCGAFARAAAAYDLDGRLRPSARVEARASSPSCLQQDVALLCAWVGRRSALCCMSLPAGSRWSAVASCRSSTAPQFGSRATRGALSLHRQGASWKGSLRLRRQEEGIPAVQRGAECDVGAGVVRRMGGGGAELR
eukprot:2743432-Prymnesium_polylepis.1